MVNVGPGKLHVCTRAATPDVSGMFDVRAIVASTSNNRYGENGFERTRWVVRGVYDVIQLTREGMEGRNYCAGTKVRSCVARSVVEAYAVAAPAPPMTFTVTRAS